MLNGDGMQGLVAVGSGIVYPSILLVMNLKVLTIPMMLLAFTLPATAQHSSRATGTAAYAELFGSGLVISFNIDHRFQGKEDGLGFRAGIGGMAMGEFANITVPLQINYLAGRDGRYFEVGIGGTYSNEGFLDIEGKEFPVIGTMTFGYRKQPVDGGFMWRIGLSPGFGVSLDDQGHRPYFLPYFPHLGLGYAF